MLQTYRISYALKKLFPTYHSVRLNRVINDVNKVSIEHRSVELLVKCFEILYNITCYHLKSTTFNPSYSKVCQSL